MRRTDTGRVRRYAAAACALLLVISCCGLGGAALAAEGNYYICYEKDDFRVYQTKRLTSSGGEYAIAPTLSKGDRFYVSDGAGRMWGSASGEPVRVTREGSFRYEVRFRPDEAYADGSCVSLKLYKPASYALSVRGANGTERSVELAYRAYQKAFEEYYASSVALAEGDVVTVLGENGERYGRTQVGGAADGIVFGRAGSYRFTFTADENFLYGDGKDEYISYKEVPRYYLLDAANGFAQTEEGRLTRNEEQVVYEEYRAEREIPASGYEYEYRIYDADSGETYFPSESGKLEVGDKGRYYVCFSKNHAYAEAGGKLYRTGLTWVPQSFDGWYVLGDFNDFAYEESAEFSELYRLVKNEEQKDYEEFCLTLSISRELLQRCGGEVQFYITDGGEKYRKPGGGNIVLTEAGDYDLLFSPEHNYGRAYHYRYTKKAEAPAEEEVRISTAEEFNRAAAASSDYEYTVNKVFVLTADIDFAGRKITPFESFNGVFDGCFHSLKNVEIESANERAALFRTVGKDGEVKRLNAQLTVRADKADECGLVGRNYGRIADVTLSGSVSGHGYAGAACGYNANGGVVERVDSSCAVDGILNAGGIAGFNAGTLKGVKNRGSVNAAQVSTADANAMLNIGGVCGYSTGRIVDAENTGKVGCEFQGRYVGGIAGLSSGEFYFCRNAGDVDGARYAGGVVGYYGRFSSSGSDIKDYLSGTGLEGFLDAYFGTDPNAGFEESEDLGVHTAAYVQNSGRVLAEDRAGGVAGCAAAADLLLSDSYSTGEVSAHNDYAGGIAGELGAGSVTSCFSAGSVACKKGSYAGGIAGLSAGLIRGCMSSARVAVDGSYAGGIAGSGGRIENCYANALVITGSGDHFGAIAGAAEQANCKYNYFIGESLSGIDGVSYGSESGYAACRVEKEQLAGTGMLPAALVGFDTTLWLAGADGAHYPSPRSMEEAAVPETYRDEAEFTALFDKYGPAYAGDAARASAVTVTVTFWKWNADSEKHELMSSVRLPYGEGLSEVPAPPEVEGCFVEWDREDFSRFTENTAVYERADRALTTLQTVTGGVRILTEGKFHSDTELQAVKTGDYYTLHFYRNGAEISYGDVTVRFLAGDGSYRVRVVDGERVADAEHTVSGAYLVFSLKAGQSFAVTEAAADTGWLIAVYVLAGAAGGAILAVAVVLVVRFGKRKRNARAQADSAPPETDEPQNGEDGTGEK